MISSTPNRRKNKAPDSRVLLYCYAARFDAIAEYLARWQPPALMLWGTRRGNLSTAMTAHTVLRTQRLLLRPFEPGDVDDALSYRDDAEFARFLSHIPQPFTRSDAEAFVDLNISEPWDRSPTFAVVLDGRVIGTVNLEVNAEARIAMLGYAIGREWWGQGIATEAARAVMAWGIEAFGLTRVWGSTDVRHLGSQRVLEKLGMRREAVRLRDHLGRDGQAIDEVVYGMNLTTTSAAASNSTDPKKEIT